MPRPPFALNSLRSKTRSNTPAMPTPSLPLSLTSDATRVMSRRLTKSVICLTCRPLSVQLRMRTLRISTSDSLTSTPFTMVDSPSTWIASTMCSEPPLMTSRMRGVVLPRRIVLSAAVGEVGGNVRPAMSNDDVEPPEPGAKPP